MVVILEFCECFLHLCLHTALTKHEYSCQAICLHIYVQHYANHLLAVSFMFTVWT